LVRSGIRRTVLAIPLLLIVAIAVLAACGGESEPQNRTFDLKIEDGKTNLDPAVIKVDQGDSVTMNIEADEHGTFHLHGYDIELDLEPGATATMEFEADATGKFDFTYHSAGGEEHEDEHEEAMEGGHAELFESETLENAGTFSFIVAGELSGETIPYHNHMGHVTTGSITVSDSEGSAGIVEIEIQGDGSFIPDEVTVQPGATLVWTNVSDIRARVASGNPPTLAEEGEHEEEEGEEIALGSLEVHPR
jgi:plastocyanin